MIKGRFRKFFIFIWILLVVFLLFEMVVICYDEIKLVCIFDFFVWFGKVDVIMWFFVVGLFLLGVMGILYGCVV